MKNHLAVLIINANRTDSLLSSNPPPPLQIKQVHILIKEANKQTWQIKLRSLKPFVYFGNRLESDCQIFSKRRKLASSNYFLKMVMLKISKTTNRLK